MTGVKGITDQNSAAQGISSSFSFIDFIILYFQLIKFIVNYPVARILERGLKDHILPTFYLSQ